MNDCPCFTNIVSNAITFSVLLRLDMFKIKNNFTDLVFDVTPAQFGGCCVIKCHCKFIIWFLMLPFHYQNLLTVESLSCCLIYCKHTSTSSYFMNHTSCHTSWGQQQILKHIFKVIFSLDLIYDLLSLVYFSMQSLRERHDKKL